MDSKWNMLLSKFRRLGGIAENVCQQEGKLGRGIFSVDPSLKARIYTPASLMVNKDDVYLAENKIRIKHETKYSRDLRDFFHFYEDHFSWGNGGKESTEFFEKGLNAFNANSKRLIKRFMLIDIEKRQMGDWDQVILRQFLEARWFKFNKSLMICPLLELVNHEVQSLPFIMGLNGISTPNYLPSNSELTYNYNNKSTINRFFSYGFFCKETIIFSLPFTINLEGKGIQIHCKGMELNDDAMIIEKDGSKFTIYGLPIADVNHPDLPREYFAVLVKKLGGFQISNDILSKIRELNILIRKNIIKESNLMENQVSTAFKSLINYEINLILSYN